MVSEADEALLDQPYLSDGDLGRRAREYLDAAEVRRDALIEDIDAALTDSDRAPRDPMPLLDGSLHEELNQLATELDNRAADIQNPNDPALATLEAEISELEARTLLKDLLPKVRAQHRRFARIRHLREREAECATNSITTAQRKLTAKAVTDALVRAFDAERSRLGYDQLQVRLRPTGRIGETKCSIESVGNKRPIKIGRLLSDGERRGLALSALLAELAVVADGAPLVIDDPVSSLDHAIRRRLAERLAEEAAKRQVIVFTHDPVFAFLLQEAAEAVQPSGEPRATIARHDIEKGTDGTGQLRRTIAEEGANVYKRLEQIGDALEAATKLREDGDSEAWVNESRLIARALRATWERAIEECLFKKVVQRFDRKVVTTALDRVVVLPTDSALVGQSMTRLSRMMHDNASAIQEPPPTPGEIQDEIDALEAWRVDVKARKHPEVD